MSDAHADEEWEALLKKIRTNSVKEVDLLAEDLSERDARRLAEALEGNRSVRFIDLSACGIGDAEAEALANVLGSTLVEGLCLGSNVIGDMGAKALAAALKVSTLRDLDLSGNEVGDEGAKALAACLQDSRLSSLNLSFNVLQVASHTPADPAPRIAGTWRKPGVPSSLLWTFGGSKVDGGDYLGWTCPFRRAIMRGHVEIVELLLGAGAKVNGSDDLGRTPLHTAVQDDDGVPHPRIMAILLGAGANVNAIDDGGRTPLHVAARQECPEIVQQLLDAGADPCIRDEEGQTAQDIALEREDEEVAEMLQGAEEEWTKPFILQVSAAGTELSFRTISGSLAATLTWSSERPTEELPAAHRGALPLGMCTA